MRWQILGQDKTGTTYHIISSHPLERGDKLTYDDGREVTVVECKVKSDA